MRKPGPAKAVKQAKKRKPAKSAGQRAKGRDKLRAAAATEINFVAPPIPDQIPFKPSSGHALEMAEVSSLVHFEQAHAIANGEGVTAAVLDSGCFTGHLDFQPSDLRIAASVNCMSDPPGDDITDASGHGTHVAGALAAKGVHIGVAPACRIVPVKILEGTGSDQSADISSAIANGLNWVLDNADRLGISVVCLSVGDNKNHADDSGFAANPVTQAILALAARNIPVVAAAGNYYGLFATKELAAEGMCYPAIVRQVVSVGAVYDQPCNDAAGRPCSLGAEYGSPSTQSSRADQLAIYTQRMEKVDADGCGTVIFAPGSWVLATGIGGNAGSSIVRQGTSQAAPVVAGVIALLQSLHLKEKRNARPDIAMLVRIIRQSAKVIEDDSEVTSLAVTGKRFLRVDALAAVTQLQQELAVA
ncbi:S8 family serine peptidase [Mesorhizobium sp. GbtcB19]|uniref:S8 family peptidase n=1 Tax=Mesorhizobium sp. GbtcB19 TaxID=2824764 RepID=UPI001C2FE990|nr:S8 family serine peptidase [Mesorhizobium sp. GbtcB19]